MVPTPQTSPPSLSRPIRLAVLLSGSGTTLENLYVEIAAGRLPVEIAVVLSSAPAAYGLQRAAQRGTPAVTVDRTRFSRWRDHAAAVWQALEPYAFDGVILAGYICRLTVPPPWKGKILNIHPALLPKFGGKGMYGHHVHAAVLAAGETESGCTVHVVDEEYDHGPPLQQTRVAVKPDDTPDTLAARVQAAERATYPGVIRDYFGKLAARTVQ